MDKPEILSNPAFVKNADAFFPYDGEWYGSRNKKLRKSAKTGAFHAPDGGIFFKIYAPGAKEVYVSCEGLTVHYGDRVNILDLEATGDDFPEYRLPLTKDAEGFFTGSLTAEDLKGFYGPFPFTFVVDGASVVHPYTRATWRSGRLMNCIEVADPDLEEKFMVRDVPHGTVAYDRFWSDTRGSWAPCMIYTPAGYGTEGKTYPLLLLQHGGGENETAWFTLGNMAEIMDNLIADGLAEPCVVVMNNTHLPPRSTGDNPGIRAFGAVEDVLIRECLPYIEQKYAVKTDKWSRAIAGLSMGAMQTSYVGFSNPDLFGYIGLFSGSIRCRRFWEDYDENPHLSAFRGDVSLLDRQYRVIYRGVGTQEYNSRPWHREDDRYLHAVGADNLQCYHFTEHPTMCHEWGCFRRSLYEFVQLLFRS